MPMPCESLEGRLSREQPWTTLVTVPFAPYG